MAIRATARSTSRFAASGPLCDCDGESLVQLNVAHMPFKRSRHSGACKACFFAPRRRCKRGRMRWAWCGELSTDLPFPIETIF